VKLTADGRALLLETNTIPGLTAQSLLPQAAKVAGYDFRRVVEILLENALLRAG
jgi:D-alanine-D-alanine ligase